jgi:hypothetical protein
MNLRLLIDEFRVRAQDTARPYLWPDDELAASATEGESEAAVRALLIRDADEIDVDAGDASAIRLPDGLFDIQHASLRDSGGAVFDLLGATRRELDLFVPGWRTKTIRPSYYIHDDKTLTLSSVPDVDYTLCIEFFRLPKSALRADEDEPEIAEVHHQKLIDWMLYRAYSKPDADAFDPNKAKDSLAAFTAYFGRRGNAGQRRGQNAGRPHRNKVHL